MVSVKNEVKIYNLIKKQRQINNFEKEESTKYFPLPAKNSLFFFSAIKILMFTVLEHLPQIHIIFF